MKNEMVEYLRNTYKTYFGNDEESFKWASETAIYWFASDYYDGDAHPLYEILCNSKYTPSCLTSGIEDEDDDMASDMYDDLVAVFNVG